MTHDPTGGRVGVVGWSVFLHEKNGALVSDQLIRSDEGLPKNVTFKDREVPRHLKVPKKKLSLVFHMMKLVEAAIFLSLKPKLCLFLHSWTPSRKVGKFYSPKEVSCLKCT